MITFPLEFEFAGLIVKATAWKISRIAGSSTQYHVYDMEPKFKNVPEVWMFIHDPKNDKFSFALPSPDLLNLGGAIMHAIRMKCEILEIELL